MEAKAGCPGGRRMVIETPWIMGTKHSVNCKILLQPEVRVSPEGQALSARHPPGLLQFESVRRRDLLLQ